MSATRPLQVGIADLRRRLGTRKPFHAEVVLDDVAISTAAVPDGAPIDVDLVLESISNGMVAEGRLTVPWVGECRRCLEPVEGSVITEVKEIFEPAPVEGETYRLGDDTVDLEPMVRDAALLALPLAPLCGPDCSGPAPDAFPARAEGERDDEVAEQLREQRWGALRELEFDDPSS